MKSISQILHMELPGMKGFSETSLKNMRKFYENWVMLDPNPSVVTAESPKSTFTNVETPSSKSTIMIADLQSKGNQAFTNSAIVIAELKDYHIDIYQSLKIPETKDFPVEDFSTFLLLIILGLLKEQKIDWLGIIISIEW